MHNAPKHTEYVLSHKLDAFKHTHRTTLRIDSETWLRFKTRCKELHITTCFAMRTFIHDWLRRTGPRETYCGGHFKYFRELQGLYLVDDSERLVIGKIRK